MSTLEQISEIVLKVKKDRIYAEILKPDATITGDLMLDSLDIAELLMLTEDAFNLEISKEEATKMKTLGDVVDYIDSVLRLRPLEGAN